MKVTAGYRHIFDIAISLIVAYWRSHINLKELKRSLSSSNPSTGSWFIQYTM